jgi:hypothetical protein
MSMTVAGLVKNGVVVPNAPLPEGAFVEVRVIPGRPEVPPELQEEFDASERAGAGTLEMVEGLAEEMDADRLVTTPAAPVPCRRSPLPSASRNSCSTDLPACSAPSASRGRS